MVKKINARDCILNTISSNAEETFLNENHLQGSALSIIAYGLYFDNELVQIMSFGRPRFNNNFQWEIIRDCTKKGYAISGGTSKLWNHFIKNNNVRSCICYSYPHNGEYTNKYVDYCDFNNVKKSKSEKKIYFEGIWNGELKRIDKSILERHGVDRLLKGDFGQDRTNEQILLDLGFEKKYEDGYSPQVDSYFPYGVLYKITDTATGKFYIGETTIKDNFENGYSGSGSSLWQNYYNKYKDIHEFKREVLKRNFKTPKELYDAEVEEIKKYSYVKDGKYIVDRSTGCMNTRTSPQNVNPVCPECGGASHKKSCSRYVAPEPCPECGATRTHKKTCSKYKQPESCPECGSLYSHKKSCSKYTQGDVVCEECGGTTGAHKKSCSQYKEPNYCPECGAAFGHKKTCSHFNKENACEYCGTPKGGHHKADCPNANLCPECGHHPHLSTCSQYKAPKVCPECGSRYKHKKTCSKYVEPKSCPDCGGKYGKHKKGCPHAKPCPECGTLNGHSKGCSKYNRNKICEECGGKDGKHKSTCSKYNRPGICPECGGKDGKHKKTCSKTSHCQECGPTHGHHKPTCSKSK